MQRFSLLEVEREAGESKRQRATARKKVDCGLQNKAVIALNPGVIIAEMGPKHG